MHSNDFEKAPGGFLETREWEQAENSLFDLLRAAFPAGWLSAGGSPPTPYKIFQVIEGDGKQKRPGGARR